MTDLELLGGARRIKTRVRGFAPWQPRDKTRALLDLVLGILDEYAAYLPLTLRQIFYRLVGAHDYQKDEKAYERLGELVNRARRARLVPMSSIRDDGGQRIAPPYWELSEAFLATVRATARTLRLDRTQGQPSRLIVSCEAAGMVPQLARVADPYGIPVISSGGFESTTERHRLAEEAAVEARLTEFLDIGDHDPSGAHKLLAFAEDIEAFAAELGGSVTVTRLAVTPAQISALGLPTTPPKKTDKRAFTGETCQAEAIAPDELARLLRQAIEERLDRAVYERVLAKEKRVQRELKRRLGPVQR